MALKILVTTDVWFPDYVGGSARVARDSAVALSRLGHEVVVLAPKADNHRPCRLAEGITVKRVIRSPRVVPRTLTNMGAFRAGVRREVGREFDVVLAHHASNAAGALLARNHPPVAYVFHASARRESVFRRSVGLSTSDKIRARIVEPVSGFAERRAAKGATSILVLSEFSRSLLTSDFGSTLPPIVNVGGGVDCERFRPAQSRTERRASLGIAKDETVILTVRRLVNRMGIDNLLEAAARLPTKESMLRLVIVGDGEERNRLEAKASSLGLGSVAQFKGRVSDEDVVAWYQVADLFVLPTVAYEGFGMVSAEALACGTPVVGTPVGATPEILGPLSDQLVAPTSSPDDLAAAMSRALSQLGPGLRSRCRDYAVDRLAWSRVVENWERVLEACL